MDAGTLFWIWLIAGGVLMISELAIPGLITFFLGLSALLVSLGYKTGLLDGIIPGFTAWFVTSLFSVFVLREFAKKMFSGESHRKQVNEDLDAFGEIVEVLEDISVENEVGRIRFRGTSWQATTTVPLIKSGSKAKIVARDNLVWIVEPFEASLLDEISLTPEG
jgi:inner membrane protein